MYTIMYILERLILQANTHKEYQLQLWHHLISSISPYESVFAHKIMKNLKKSLSLGI